MNAGAILLAVGFAGAAILGMRQRNEVVHEIDRALPRLGEPGAQPRIVQARVADVEVQALLRILGRPWRQAARNETETEQTS